MRVSIDTLILVAKLPYHAVTAMFDSIQFYAGNEHYRYMKRNAKHESFYVILFQPLKTYLLAHYNVMLIMKNETLQNMPDSVKTLIRLTSDWMVKREDIAFDYETPIHLSLPVVNGNATVKQYDNGNYYLYTSHSPVQACVYDKAREQLKRKGIATVDDWTRMELRLRPQKLSEASIYDLTWIPPKLEKITWVSNINAIGLNKGQLELARKIQRRVGFNWRKISNKEKTALRLALEAGRSDFAGLFEENKSELLKWIWTAFCEPLSQKATNQAS